MKTCTPLASKAFRTCRITIDIPLGIGRPALSVASVVAPIHASAHQHNSLELANHRRIPLDGRLHIEQRADGDERDLARMVPSLVQNKLDPILMLSFRGAARIRCLRKYVLMLRWRARGYGNLHTNCAQVPVHQPGARLRIAILRRDSQQLNLRALEREGKGKGIVDVVADVRIEND